ncbi:hypothetical protein AVEN_207605-1, partial [Araneus ventricosus]
MVPKSRLSADGLGRNKYRCVCHPQGNSKVRKTRKEILEPFALGRVYKFANRSKRVRG